LPAESGTGRSLRAKKRLLPKTPPRLSPHHPRQSPGKSFIPENAAGSAAVIKPHFLKPQSKDKSEQTGKGRNRKYPAPEKAEGRPQKAVLRTFRGSLKPSRNA